MNTKSHMLTQTQHDTLRFIERYIQQHGYAPSLRDIGKALDIGLSAVHARLQQLARLGHIQREPEISRSIRVIRGTGEQT